MYKKREWYYTKIRINGRVIYKALGTKDKKEARLREGLLFADLKEGKYRAVIDGKRTVAEMLDRFVVVHGQKVSQAMRNSYRFSMKHLNKFFCNMSCILVGPRELSEYKFIRNKEKASAATINRELACLGAAYNVAVREWEWLPVNPVTKIAKERENNLRIRFLSDDEEQRLLTHESMPSWLHNVVVFALNTGMRRGEIQGLQWEDVDFFNKAVLLRKTKSGKPRTVPLIPPALGLLKQMKKVRSLRHNYVFKGHTGERLGWNWVSQKLARVCVNSKILDFHFHDLRHTFASRMVQGGMDIRTLAEILGHSSLRMTMRYSHMNASHALSAANEAHARRISRENESKTGEEVQNEQ